MRAISIVTAQYSYSSTNNFSYMSPGVNSVFYCVNMDISILNTCTTKMLNLFFSDLYSKFIILHYVCVTFESEARGNIFSYMLRK